MTEAVDTCDSLEKVSGHGRRTGNGPRAGGGYWSWDKIVARNQCCSSSIGTGG